ncbi:MAG: Two-component, sigma54 specific, transcriptional regulator, Fis family [Deltaproteobacteria bacterium]|jgi:DNA-binding NtrC family response regulator|nr:Two-component, sigma54 specific, transcriptional regulator, Fis family [Deltaproteobacteria bacterium]
MEKGRILVVDDEENVLNVLTEYLTSKGYKIDPYSSSEAALVALKKNENHVMITDLKMPKIDGIQLIKYIQQEYLNTLGIVLTGYGSLETAISAMNHGAFAYILKPFKFEELLSTVESAMHYYELLNSDNIPSKLVARGNLLRRFAETKAVRENTILRSQMRDKYKFENIVGASLQMQKVFEMVEKVADTSATVLITGESGVGKELVARAIHYNSSRRTRPLVVVNCGAIPEELLESELFGHERGAFTGAIKTRFGRFELADGGTVFLDEIGDMSLTLQVKLLRVLQEKCFERIGGSKTIHVDVRIIAATNQDLDALVASGKFREDLFYRLNVVPIHIPPLRERRQDVPLLLNHFLERSNKMNNGNIEGVTEQSLDVFTSYDYPGNVRELQNIVERLVVIKKSGLVSIEDLPEKMYGGKPEEELEMDVVKGYDTLVNDFEKSLIMKALNQTKGVKSQAARLLQMNRTTLIEKMKRLGIE